MFGVHRATYRADPGAVVHLYVACMLILILLSTWYIWCYAFCFTVKCSYCMESASSMKNQDYLKKDVMLFCVWLACRRSQCRLSLDGPHLRLPYRQLPQAGAGRFVVAGSGSVASATF
jgi:hypothetical protein